MRIGTLGAVFGGTAYVFGLALGAGTMAAHIASADCGGCISLEPGVWRPPSPAWVLAVIEVYPDGTITRRGKPLAELTRTELEQVIRDLAGDVVTNRGR